MGRSSTHLYGRSTACERLHRGMDTSTKSNDETLGIASHAVRSMKESCIIRVVRNGARKLLWQSGPRKMIYHVISKGRVFRTSLIDLFAITTCSAGLYNISTELYNNAFLLAWSFCFSGLICSCLLIDKNTTLVSALHLAFLVL